MAARGTPVVRTAGFTLVELLVALVVMALLSLMSWRGLDGMVRTQAATQARSDDLLALQSGLAQWDFDLDAVADVPTPMAWSGQSLRIVRYSGAASTAGLQVVAWARRETGGAARWLRWQSPVVQSQAELQVAWLAAEQWAQNPGEAARRREVAITPLADWQVFYYRGDAWSNPSSSSASGAAASTAVPDGVRLVLTLPPGGALSGVITRDWVRPALSAGKS
jgi:general secretion pathway protein J